MTHEHLKEEIKPAPETSSEQPGLVATAVLGLLNGYQKGVISLGCEPKSSEAVRQGILRGGLGEGKQILWATAEVMTKLQKKQLEGTWLGEHFPGEVPLLNKLATATMFLHGLVAGSIMLVSPQASVKYQQATIRDTDWLHDPGAMDWRGPEDARSLPKD